MWRLEKEAEDAKIRSEHDMAALARAKQMNAGLGEDADDAAIARSLHSGLLEPEDVGAFRSFMMNWHSLLAPGYD